MGNNVICMKKRKLVFAASLLVVAIVSVVWGVNRHVSQVITAEQQRAIRNTKPTYQVPSDAEAGRWYQLDGILTVPEYSRLTRIGSSSGGLPNISDDDLEFALGLIRSKPIIDKPDKAQLRHILAIEALLRVTDWKQSQMLASRKTILPLTGSHNKKEAWFARQFLMHLRKKPN